MIIRLKKDEIQSLLELGVQLEIEKIKPVRSMKLQILLKPETKFILKELTKKIKRKQETKFYRLFGT